MNTSDFAVGFKMPQEPRPMPHVGSDDEEESFVVLGTCSLDANEASIASTDSMPALSSDRIRELRETLDQEIVQASTSPPVAVEQVVKVSPSLSHIFSPDSSVEEVQKHVEEIINENANLKRTIAQTNINMKNQHDKILAWKEEVTEVCKVNKNKVIEARECLAKKNEEVDKYKQIKQLQDEEIILLRNQLKEKPNEADETGPSSENHVLKCDLQTSRDKVKDLEIVLEDVKVKNVHLTAENQKLVNSLASLEEQLTRQRVEHQEKHMLEVQTSERSQSNKWILEKEDMLKVIAKLRAMIQHQEVELENSEVSHTSKLQSWALEKNLMEEEIVALKAKAQHQESELRHLNREISNKNQENAASHKLLTDDMMDLHNQITALKNENSELKKANGKLSKDNKQKGRRTSGDYTELLNQKQYEIDQLQASIEDRNAVFEKKIAKLKQQITNETGVEEQNSTLAQQLRSAQQLITQLQQAQDVANAEIDKIKNVIHLKNDDIFALKEQVNLYKTDFEAERDSRNSLKSQCDQLSEDLENLHRRNEELQEEVRILRGTSDYSILLTAAGANATATSPNAQSSKSPSLERYDCPKCNFGFKNYQALENHVFRCIDEE